MRGGVDGVEEPGAVPDGGGDAEGEILGELEGLEVVDDNGLVELEVKLGEGAGEQEQAVTAEAGAEACDGGGGASERAGDLAVGGAGKESGGDRDEELGALEKVPSGEGLTGEGAVAVKADEAGDASAAGSGVEAVAAEAKGAGGAAKAVGGAVRVGTERGPEGLQSMDGGEGPVHGWDEAGSVPGRPSGPSY